MGFSVTYKTASGGLNTITVRVSDCDDVNHYWQRRNYWHTHNATVAWVELY